MATKLADLTVGADGSWSSGPHTLASGAHSVTLRRKSDGAVLVTRGFTVASSSTSVSDDFNRFNTPGTWASGTYYTLDSYIFYSGHTYRSLQGPNQGHQPDISPTWWSDLGAFVGLSSANWITLTGCTYWAIVANQASPGTGTSGDRWNASFNSNHYSEAETGTTESRCPVAVRMQSGAHSCYVVEFQPVDEGEGYMSAAYYIGRVVAGSYTRLSSAWAVDDGGAGMGFHGVWRLEASGTTLTLKTSTTHGGTFTSRLTVTNESSLTGGAPGLYSDSYNIGGTADNWYGGDLA